jgi:predicted GNAT family acetyltransferase
MGEAVTERDVSVRDVPDRRRFEVVVDGNVAGFVTYGMEGDALALQHTEVDDAYEGQGLGSVLVKAALDTARERGVGVLPYCPFVNAYLRRHRELVDLVPEAERARFGL